MSLPNPSHPVPARWLSRNVIALGLVSLLTDTGSEMILPLLPALLASLGAGAMALGWIEGLADFLASVLKLVAGRASDQNGKRRNFVLLGYGVSALVRPCLALAASAAHVTLIRALDRVGKGLRGSPRDALIAHSVPARARGRAFGFHRSMDHAGAALGPCLAIALLYGLDLDLRALFAAALIPGLLTLGVIVFGVREVEAPANATPRAVERTRAPLARFLLPLGLFTLSKASDLFLMQALLDAGSAGRPTSDTQDLAQFSLAWVGIHVVKTLAAYPGGALSDRFGRKRMIALGWIMHALACLGLAFATTPSALLGWFALWGLQDGLTEGPQKAFISELAPARAQGGAFGVYHFTIGALSLAASVLFGTLYQGQGQSTAFLCSSALALLASLLFGLLQRSAETRSELR